MSKNFFNTLEELFPQTPHWQLVFQARVTRSRPRRPKLEKFQWGVLICIQWQCKQHL